MIALNLSNNNKKRDEEIAAFKRSFNNFPG